MNNYNAHRFSSPGNENAAGEFSEADRAFMNAIRSLCPELKGWGDLALVTAWAEYSQDVYLVSWLTEQEVTIDRKGLVEFLAFINYREIVGPTCRGISPDELCKFAEEHSIK